MSNIVPPQPEYKNVIKKVKAGRCMWGLIVWGIIGANLWAFQLPLFKGAIGIYFGVFITLLLGWFYFLWREKPKEIKERIGGGGSVIH